MVFDIQTVMSTRFEYTSVHTGYNLTMIRSCGFTKKRRKSMTLQIRALTMQTGRRGNNIWWKQLQEEVREYLLLGLYTCTALRFSAPIIHLLVLFWMEKAHPLCTTHIVPIQKSTSFKIQSLTKPNLIGSVQPLAFWHKPQSRIFWSLWKCRRSLPNHSIHMSALVPVLSYFPLWILTEKEGKKIIKIRI